MEVWTKVRIRSMITKVIIAKREKTNDLNLTKMRREPFPPCKGLRHRSSNR